MIIEKAYIHHIYNQGNNGRKIFFNRDNYLFFLRKIETYIKPYCDILAWCLMPNHFHLMVYVNEVELPIVRAASTVRARASKGFTQSEALTGQRSFNDSIGIMLRSYTRAINKQEYFSGSLFRKTTKAECVNCPKGIATTFINYDGITKINVKNPERQYPQVCFDYIHQNPVKSGLVKKAVDWEFSSAGDFAEVRNWKLVNKKVAGKYVNIVV